MSAGMRTDMSTGAATDAGMRPAQQPPGGDPDRRAARWIGVLFVIGTVSLVLSLLLTGALLSGPDYLDRVAAQPGRLAGGALLVLVGGFALALVPVVFWRVGRRYDETLAMGYVVFRGGLETLLYIGIALCWLLLITLSTQPDATPAADLVRSAGTVVSEQLIGIPFALGAAMFCLLLYRHRLVPRWLSGWGMGGAALYLVAPLGSMFGVPMAPLMAVLAVQEMVLAVWLLARGFR